jgi:dihydrofolate reductase
MAVSLDGYIVGPDGRFDWTAPDEEVFRFWIDEIREVGVHLMGRRLYETMLYWETADQNPSLDDAELEWIALWKPLSTSRVWRPSRTPRSMAERTGLRWHSATVGASSSSPSPTLPMR